MQLIYLCIFCTCFLPSLSYSYIDPGSGGYLISHIMVMIGGFFAFASAFVIHFFRNTLVGWMRFLWHHKIITMVGILFLASIIVLLMFFVFRSPKIPLFDPALSGVRTYNSEKSYNGYNFYNDQIIDMNGNVINKWEKVDFGVLDKNGDLYAKKSKGYPVWGRYTWDDKIVWERNFPIHHEMYLTPYDTVITFTKDFHLYNGRKVEFDIIVEYDKPGNELQRFDLWEHFHELHKYHKKNFLDEPLGFLRTPKENPMRDMNPSGYYDYYHLNSLTFIPENIRKGTSPMFNPGNWLISIRHGGILFILDKDTKQVLWSLEDDQIPKKVEGPHSPHMLESGNIIFFDNGSDRKWSRVVEIDPVTKKIVWEYKGKKFFTLTQGFVQKLPNGNLLITETEKGRSFEITPEKEIIWEYYNPIKLEIGFRKEIYRMTRYSKDTIDKLIKAKK